MAASCNTSSFHCTSNRSCFVFVLLVLFLSLQNVAANPAVACISDTPLSSLNGPQQLLEAHHFQNAKVTATALDGGRIAIAFANGRTSPPLSDGANTSNILQSGLFVASLSNGPSQLQPWVDLVYNSFTCNYCAGGDTHSDAHIDAITFHPSHVFSEEGIDLVAFQKGNLRLYSLSPSQPSPIMLFHEYSDLPAQFGHSDTTFGGRNIQMASIPSARGLLVADTHLHCLRFVPLVEQHQVSISDVTECGNDEGTLEFPVGLVVLNKTAFPVLTTYVWDYGHERILRYKLRVLLNTSSLAVDSEPQVIHSRMSFGIFSASPPIDRQSFAFISKLVIMAVPEQFFFLNNISSSSDAMEQGGGNESSFRLLLSSGCSVMQLTLPADVEDEGDVQSALLFSKWKNTELYNGEACSILRLNYDIHTSSLLMIENGTQPFQGSVRTVGMSNCTSLSNATPTTTRSLLGEESEKNKRSSTLTTTNASSDDALGTSGVCFKTPQSSTATTHIVLSPETQNIDAFQTTPEGRLLFYRSTSNSGANEIYYMDTTTDNGKVTPTLLSSTPYPHSVVAVDEGDRPIFAYYDGTLRNIKCNGDFDCTDSSSTEIKIGALRTYGFVNGKYSTSTRFGGPNVAILRTADKEHYVTDTENHCIRYERQQTISNFVGACQQQGFVDGVGTAARFKNPLATWFNDSHFIVVDDNGLRSVDRNTLNVQTLMEFSLSAGEDLIRWITKVAHSPLNLYVLASRCTIYLLDVDTSSVSTLTTSSSCAFKLVFNPQEVGSTTAFVSVSQGTSSTSDQILALRTWTACESGPSTPSPPSATDDTPTPRTLHPTPAPDSLVTDAPDTSTTDGPSASGATTDNQLGMIIGIAVGGFALAALLIIWLFCCLKKRTSTESQSAKRDAVTADRLQRYAAKYEEKEMTAVQVADEDGNKVPRPGFESVAGNANPTRGPDTLEGEFETMTSMDPTSKTDDEATQQHVGQRADSPQSSRGFTVPSGMSSLVSTTDQKHQNQSERRVSSIGSSMFFKSASPGTHSMEVGSNAISVALRSQILHSIENDEVIRVKMLGRGAFGSVYSCVAGEGAIIAVKEMLLPEALDRSHSFVADVHREMDLVSKIEHPNVIRYYGCKFDHEESKLLLYMELASGGSLATLCRNAKKELPETTAKVYLRQVLEGLAHVHSKGVVHRDLKCDNVLLTTDGQCKLCDFGTSKFMSTTSGATKAAQTMIGTPLFMAPEMLLDGAVEEDEDEAQVDGNADGTTESSESQHQQQNGGYTKKADIWSFGIMALELLNRGNPPWPNFTNQGAALMHIASNRGKPRVPERLSPEFKDFIGKACDRNPTTRLTAAELLHHPWIDISCLFGSQYSLGGSERAAASA